MSRFPDHRACIRCTHECKHVEASGIWYCPNCGPAQSITGDDRHVTYKFWQGCKRCGIPGRGYQGQGVMVALRRDRRQKLTSKTQ